ncbi:Mitochondrial distribution and morphology protein 12, partial [Cryomyces antarcticus]
MPRSVPQPRIAIVTFALEYSRHGQHFMSLEPVIAQEREYLRNLVNRIAALRPQILLVQRNVSGLALQYLDEANITVAYNIKESVLNAVARCTQTRMISSEQRLPSDPSNLGSCESFDVKTYVHKGRKKTYLYLSGCTKSLGCTIVLRGAEIETLRSVKRITEFMCYVVYNLKLETSLMRDEFVLIPSSIGHGDTSPSNKPAHKAVQETPPKPAPPSDVVAEASSKLKGMVEKVSKDADSVADFSKKDVFANPSLPNEDAINKAKGTESLVADDIQVPDDLPMPTFYGDM